MSKTTNKKSLVERAYDEVKKKILDNEYYPGFQALEQEIAADLGVSRTPVREALIRLQHEGLVELIPRRGMRVVPIVASDMKEIYDVLTSLESMAAELLARQHPDSATLEPMKQATADMEVALQHEDLDAWARADERYHRCLIDLCGNRRLANMANTVRDQGHRARMVTLRLRDKPVASIDEHRQVLDAIERGDWQTARDVHYQHRKRASDELTNILEKYKLPQL
ncbi:MAG: GntR family transcriptional regulator [Woeseiaceae bacterium]|nr:GntR family transcriptional regulator [Woeseiaceae bacterium]